MSVKKIFKQSALALILCLIPISTIVVLLYNNDYGDRAEILDYIFEQRNTLEALGFSTIQLQGETNTVLVYDNYGGVFGNTAVYSFNQTTKRPELFDLVLYLDSEEQVPILVETVHRILQLANDSLEDSQDKLVYKVTAVKNIDEFSANLRTKNGKTITIHAVEWVDTKYVVRIALVSNLQDLAELEVEV